VLNTEGKIKKGRKKITSPVKKIKSLVIVSYCFILFHVVSCGFMWFQIVEESSELGLVGLKDFRIEG
jgi:hypothetical protein